MRLVVDLESNGLYNDVTKLHCIVAKDIESSRISTFVGKDLEKGINMLDRADSIIGHNFIDYDMRVIEKLYNVKLDVNKIIDTLLLSHMLYPHHSRHPDCPASKETIKGRRQIGPHSLENWGYYLGEGKIEYEDWTVYTPEMLERCKGDVSITEKLYNKFRGE